MGSAFVAERQGQGKVSLLVAGSVARLAGSPTLPVVDKQHLHLQQVEGEGPVEGTAAVADTLQLVAEPMHLVADLVRVAEVLHEWPAVLPERLQAPCDSRVAVRSTPGWDAFMIVRLWKCGIS